MTALKFPREHGTLRGCNQHKKLRESMCNECRVFWTTWMREYRRRTGRTTRMLVAVGKGSRVCPGGDPTCPCQDGDLCHYEGPDAWPIPSKKGST